MIGLVNRGGSFLLGLLLLSTIATPSQATERWHILVMGETTGAASTPLLSAYRHADEVITQQLIEQDYDVYDKDAVGAGIQCGEGPCATLPNAQLIELAKGATKKIDLILVYSIVVSERQGPAVSRWQVRVPGRMVDIATGRVVDQWSGSTREYSDRPRGCTGDCLTNWQVEKVGFEARDLGAVLQEKLSAYRRIFDYRIELRRFPATQLEQIERALSAVEGSQGGGLKATHNEQTRQWLHKLLTRYYEYRTTLGGGALNRELDRIFAEKGLITVNTYDANSRLYTSEYTGIGYLERYIGLLLATVLALLGLVFWQRYRGQTKVRLAGQMREKARLALDEGRYNEAIEEYRQADTLHSDHQLDQHIETANAKAKAEQLVRDAGSEASLSVVMAKLAQALRLEPERVIPSDLLTSVNARWQDKMGQLMGSADFSSDNLDPARFYSAVSSFDSDRHQYRTLLDPVPPELLALRQTRVDQFAGRYQLTETDLIATGALKANRVLLGDRFEIGRSGESEYRAIAIGYKRLSKVGRQTQLRRLGQQLQIMDQGSSNGSVLADQLLTDNKAVAVEQNAELILGGKKQPFERGLCRLQLRASASDSSTWIMAPHAAMHRLIDRTGMLDAWPTLEQDIDQRWVLLNRQVEIGVHPSGYLDLGCLHSDSQAAARLICKQGFFIEPITDTDHNVCICGCPIVEPMPLTTQVDISIDGLGWTFEALS